MAPDSAWRVAHDAPGTDFQAPGIPPILYTGRPILGQPAGMCNVVFYGNLRIMSESDKRDHWDLLARELGAAPPASANREAQQEAAPEAGEADYPQEEGEATPADSVESSAVTVAPETDAAPNAEQPVSFDITAPDPFPLLTVDPALGPDAADEAQAVEQEIDEGARAKAEPTRRVEERGAARPRKRRQGRRQPEPTSGKPTESAEKDAEPAELEEEELIEADTADHFESDEPDTAVEDGADIRSKRRRRRRGGRRKADAKREAEADEAGDIPRTGAAADESDEADQASGKAREAAESQDGEKEKKKRQARNGKPAHRNIPTWEEAVAIIVSANLETRAKSPGPSTASRSSRGRNRGGRSRSGEGSGK